MFAATAFIGFMALTTALTPAGKVDYYQGSDAESTTTSTSFQTKTQLVFTPEDNTDYFICYTASVSCTSVSSDVNAKLVNTTSATDLSIINIEPQDALNWHNISGCVRQSFGASPGAQTYEIQYDVEAASTAGIRNARIWAIKADTLDQYAASDADSTTTSATLQDKTTLTWTPPTSGYYLLLFMAEHNVNSTTNAAELALDINGTTYYVASQVQQDTSNYRTWAGFKIENLAASSQTIKIQYRSLAGSTVTIRRARIIAIRLDAFPNYYNAEQLTRQTTTNSGMDWGQQLALSFTPQQKNHIVLCSANVDYAGSTTQGFNIWDGTGPGRSINFQTPHGSSTPFTSQVALSTVKTYGAGSRSAKIQMSQSNLTGSADTVSLDEMSVAILEVGSRSAVNAGTTSSSSNSTTIYADHLVKNHTPDASSVYLLLTTTVINGGASALNTRLRIQDTTGGTTINESQFATKNSADRPCVATAGLYTSGGSPSATDFAVQIAAGAGTTTAYNSEINLIKLGVNDGSGSSVAESTTTSTSRQDKVSVNITPGSQDDYFIVMGCDVGHSSTSSSNGVDTVIDVDGVEYKLTQTAMDGATDYKSIMHVASVNLTAALHTIKLRYNNTAASGTAKIRNAYLAIIRRSDWNATYFSEQNTLQSGGVAKDFRWIDAVTATHTLNAGSHIFIGIGNMNYNSISRPGWGRVIDDDLTGEVATNEEPAATANEMPFFSFYRRTMRNEALQMTFNQTSDATSTNTSGADDIGLVAIQVET